MTDYLAQIAATAMRAGNSRAEVLLMSPREIAAVALAHQQNEAISHYRNAEAARLGMNADEKTFTEFHAAQMRMAGLK